MYQRIINIIYNNLHSTEGTPIPFIHRNWRGYSDVFLMIKVDFLGGKGITFNLTDQMKT